MASYTFQKIGDAFKPEISVTKWELLFKSMWRKECRISLSSDLAFHLLLQRENRMECLKEKVHETLKNKEEFKQVKKIHNACLMAVL